MLQRVAAILLVLWLGALATGGPQYLHHLEHAAHHVATPDGDEAPALPPDERTDECPVCFLLHLPMLVGSFVALLICLVLCLTQAPAFLKVYHAQRLALAIACRGPPHA